VLPRLESQNPVKEEYLSFLKDLDSQVFGGEIKTDFATRLVTATDNSIYQVLPEAVIYPRSTEDVVTLFKLLNQKKYRSIKVSPRGGGTGTNGQSLCSGIILDLSKYLDRILELNLEEGWVEVEPGVILDELNAYLKPHGVFFAPSLSTSNRATLGGMINTDACGKGSRIYGKTSEHVVELELVLTDGTKLITRKIGLDHLDIQKKKESREGDIYSQVDEIILKKKDLIDAKLPKLKRFLSGYNLQKLRDDEGHQFNLSYLIGGSEGTLATVTSAKLLLTQQVKHKKLLLLKYLTFDAALRDARVLLQAEPAAIETIDDNILTLAKVDEIYGKVKHMVTGDSDQPPAAINLVEFIDDDLEKLDQKINALMQQVDANREKPEGASGYYCAVKEDEISVLWDLRKKGVGLLGSVPGKRKPIAFVEDTVVPPENLADYIVEFRALLDRHGLKYGMFGHVDVGCLHVRPALDMQDPDDEKKLFEISDEVSNLVQKYGGLMWGEHGKGYRSQYLPQFLGDELYSHLRKIKEVFDPNNQLNPGKIATPLSSCEDVIDIHGPTRGQKDREIDGALQHEFEASINCNGNGACFNYDPSSVMCPSARYTKDRLHSPKGRSAVVREWIRRLSKTGEVGEGIFAPEEASSLFKGIHKLGNRIAQSIGVYDYSHEVYRALAGCLSCKACAVQCPIRVDVPEFKAKFLDSYHSRYLRPIMDYLAGGLEWAYTTQAKFPKLINRINKLPLTRSLLQKTFGLVDSPELSEQTLQQGLKQRNAPALDLPALARLTREEKTNSVLILQDAFTSFHEAKLVLSFYDLLGSLGYRVVVIPFFPNGKALHIKGFLKEFRDTALKNIRTLQKIAALNISIVGIDPAVVLTYRDEYLKVSGNPDPGFSVLLPQEWLETQLERPVAKVLQNKLKNRVDGEKEFTLFGHCTEKTAALESQQQWQNIFTAFGVNLKLANVGCCGMCGIFGHEHKNQNESRGIYDLSWKKKIPKESKEREQILVTGFSCRDQVERFDHFKAKHPIEALYQLIQEATLPNH